MSKDRSAVVWTRMGPQPVKMGSLTVTDTQARFTYEPHYAETGLRGLGLVYPADQFNTTIVRERSNYFDLLPPIQALVPPRSEHNFQRALMLRYLDSINLHPQPGFETDWELLVRSGHGGIGHLDVFEHDEAALQWYATPSRKGLVQLDDKFGFSLKEFMTWFDDVDDAQNLIDILGPTPTVGGAIPKLMLSIPETGWDGRIGLPTRFGDSERRDIILKLENTTTYPGIIELEQLALEMHQAAGYEVPRFWPVEVSGLRALAIERFDRSAQCNPVFMETLYSILASGSSAISNHYSASYDRVGQALGTPRIRLVDDIKAARQHLFDRLILAMLTGNGDLHLENMAICERNGSLAFSPVYDPTPMRAYKIHNMLSPPGMTFGDYGDLPDNRPTDEPVGFSEAVVRFAKNLGIQKNSYSDSIERALAQTADYPQRIDALETVPGENKKQLIKVHQHVRQKMSAVTIAKT